MLNLNSLKPYMTYKLTSISCAYNKLLFYPIWDSSIVFIQF